MHTPLLWHCYHPCYLPVKDLITTHSRTQQECIRQIMEGRIGLATHEIRQSMHRPVHRRALLRQVCRRLWPTKLSAGSMLQLDVLLNGKEPEVTHAESAASACSVCTWPRNQLKYTVMQRWDSLQPRGRNLRPVSCSWIWHTYNDPQ